MSGITHFYHAALDTIVIATDNICGVPLRAWYVFEVSNDPSELPMEPIGPFRDQNDAVDRALAIVHELHELDQAIKASPGDDLGL